MGQKYNVKKNQKDTISKISIRNIIRNYKTKLIYLNMKLKSEWIFWKNFSNLMMLQQNK